MEIAEVISHMQEQRKKLNFQLNRLDKAIDALSGFGSIGKRRLSPAARARIAAAQRERWAKWRRARRKAA